MKYAQIMFCLAAFMSVAGTAAEMVVTNVVAAMQTPWNGLVDVDYEIQADDPTMEFYVQVECHDHDRGEFVCMSTLTGDGAADPVKAGRHRLVWNVGKDRPDFNSSDFSVRVTAWSGSPPYLVVDLAGGVSSATYPIRYSASGPDLKSDTCRTTELWMKLVHPGKFRMGSPVNEIGRQNLETLHDVTLTQPFYMAVFETTRCQWRQITGSNIVVNTWWGNLEDCQPIGNVSYCDIRGGESGLMWPTSRDVDTSSFLGLIRAKTAMTFDLPTSAQWEYACRAGTKTALNNGLNLTSTNMCPNIEKIARYRANRASTTSNATVGSYQPNVWGFYDMHGNAGEWCLDRYPHAYVDAVDPVGGIGTTRAFLYRKGTSNHVASFSRSADIGYYNPERIYSDIGFRMVVVSDDEHPFSVASATAESIGTRLEQRWDAAVDAQVNSIGPIEAGFVSADTEWTSNTIHVVRNWVTVPEGVTLTICPGTEVRFCDGAGIYVDGGNVIVTGAVDAAVTFLSVQSGGAVNILAANDGKWSEIGTVTYDLCGSSVEILPAVVSEDCGCARIPVTLTRKSTRTVPESVRWWLESDTAHEGADYENVSGTVSWTALETLKYIEIPIISDRVVEGNETFYVRVEPLAGCYIASDRDVPVTIYDSPIAFGDSFEGGESGTSTEGASLDTFHLGETRVAGGDELITYGTDWDEVPADAARVTVLSPDGLEQTLSQLDSPSGFCRWTPSTVPGIYTLCHDAGGERLSVCYAVLGEESVHVGSRTISEDEMWQMDKVYVIDGLVTIDAGVSLTIPAGTVVKFMTGSELLVKAGGTCIAKGVIFTHISDDAVGGDTLGDGDASIPPENAYAIQGIVDDDATTSYRYASTTCLRGWITSDMQLKAGRVYVVAGSVSITNDVTVTVNPGAIVKFVGATSMSVYPGALLYAKGTRAAAVVFTSYQDDAHGGDTNGDGDRSIPQPGDWNRIASLGGRIELSHARILYGSRGGMAGAVNVRTGKAVLNDTEIAHSAYDAIGVETGGDAYVTNCVIRDALAAFRHYNTNEIVNCVVYDCGRITQAGNHKFRNCVFSEITDVWQSGQQPNNFRNCCFWNKGGTMLTGDVAWQVDQTQIVTQDASVYLNRNGNVWGDPLFADPMNGDFRIQEGSACVDAADGTVVPETDLYGQPRVTLLGEPSGIPTSEGCVPDIGVSELMPRNMSADVDFEARRVTAAGPVAPGDEITVKWTVGNLGGREVDGSWRDTVSLVSANGRVVTLGEKVTTGRVPAGGSIVCSGSFTVPTLAEGTWYPKVQVNTYRDVFEGSLTENNAVQGTDPVEVSVAATDMSAAVVGRIVAGVPTVLKLPFTEDASNRLVRMTLPEGVTASWGFGFMPTTGRTGGSPVQSGGGISDGHDVLFLAPDGEQTVYVVLESGSTVDYSLTFEEFALRIDTVSPSVVKCGEKRFVIATGTGFTSDTKLLLSAGAYSEEVSCSILSTSEVMFYLDATKFASGTIISVKAQSETVSSTNDGVVTIVDDVGEGKLRFELDLPETARAKRISIGYVEYGNVGNADMVVPILNLVGNGGTVVSLASHFETFSNSCTIVGVSKRPPHGMLKAGETVRLPFYFIPGEEYSISLGVLNADNVAERDSVFPTWKSYCEGMAEAATRECVSGHLVYDFQTIYNRAMRMAYEQDETSLSGFLYNRATSLPMVGETLLLTDTNYTVIATAVTDADGSWTFRDLPMNETYEVVAKTCNLCTQTYLVSGKNAGAVRLVGMPLCTFSLRVNNLTDCDLDRAGLCAIDQNGTITPAHFTSDGRAVFSNMADGVYDLAFKSDDWCCITGKNEIVISVGEVVPDNHVEMLDILPSGSVNVSIADVNNSCVFSNVVCSLLDEHGGIVAYGITDQNGSVRFNAPPGSYDLAIGTKVQRSNDDKIDIIGAFSAECVVPASVVPFVIDSSVGEIPLKAAVVLIDEGTWGTNFTCEWDFDGDGVVDSSDISPTNIYTETGTYSIGLRVTTSDGRVFNYQKREAVMAWEALPTKMADGAFTIDDNSGYDIIYRTEDTIKLQRIPGRDAIILVEGDIIVDPSYPLMPRKIVSIIVNSSEIYLETEFVELPKAYATLTVSSPMQLLSVPKYEKNTFDVPNCNPYLEVKGSALSAKGQAFIKNGICNLYLLDGKIRVVQLNFDCKVNINAGVNVKAGWNQQKVQYYYAAYIAGRMKCSGTVKSQVSYETSWKRVCYTKYDLYHKKDYEVDIKELGDGSKPKLDFKGSISGKLGMELEVGIGVIDPKKDRKATIVDAKVGVGFNVNAGVDLSASETSADRYYYSYGPYADWEFNILHAKAKWLGLEWELGAFKEKGDFNIKWSSGDKWEWKTPLPRLQIESVGGYNNGKVPVTFESATSVPYDSVFKARSWEGCCKGSGESCTASLRARKQDTVAYEVILRETYAPKKLDFSILDSVGLWRSKLAKKRITVSGPENDDAKNFEVVRRGDQIIIKSKDPNEMAGPMGKGDPDTQRFVEPGQWLTYTVYYENDASATAAAQEVFVTNSLSQYLDWSTFEMGEVAFGDQIDLGLVEKQNGTNEVTMTGTNLIVRSVVDLDKEKGEVRWYMRVVDPDSGDTWPTDVTGGFLPPNDKETHCGEGHLTYRIKVRDDAPRGVRIDNSATIVFDTEDPIETDPAWWNIIATHQDVSMTVDGVATNLDLIVGMPYGDLPTPSAWAGHTFAGWYTGPNGTGRRVTVQSIVQAGDSALYGYWLTNAYTVHFEPNGGVGLMSDQAFEFDKPGTLDANAFTRKYYAFDGWTTNETGAAIYGDCAVVTNLTTVSNGVVTLYATWRWNAVEVEFDAQGGTPAPENSLYELGKPYGVLPDVALAGYTFGGWYTGLNGAGDRVTAQENAQTEVAKLYAHWLAHAYTVRYNANGGTGVMSDQAFEFDKSGSLDANAFTRKDYAFDGWATNATGSVVYADGAEVKNLTDVDGGVVGLFAVWKAVPQLVPEPEPEPQPVWMVLFDANGGEGSMAAQMFTNGVTQMLSANGFTRFGYDFAGWATSADGEVVYADGQRVKMSSAQTLYAQWEEIKAGTLDTSFAKAQTVDGALYDKRDRLVGTVQVKVGKISKKGIVKLSATATLIVDGKTKKVAAKAVNVELAATSAASPVKVVFKAPIGEMAFEMKADGTFTLKNASYLMAKAKIGGALNGGSRGTFRLDDFHFAVKGELQDELIPYEEPFKVKGNSWTFEKAATVKWAKDKKTKQYGLVVDDSKGKTNLSGLKLTYTLKTGQFKGSFKAYALETTNGKTKLVKYTVNVIGFVVDGVGHGEASCKKPAGGPWSVTVE